MELIEKINFEIAKMPNLKQLESRQLPCGICVQDREARKEINQVQSHLTDNTAFSRELIATYHAILHTDIQSALLMLYFKDIKYVIAIQMLAKNVEGRDGSGEENTIYQMC